VNKDCQDRLVLPEPRVLMEQLVLKAQLEVPVHKELRDQAHKEV
jgi:hypothetical protein